MSVAPAVPVPPSALPPTPGLSPLRRRVYEAAVVLFGERGYGLVSVRDIAAELGVTPAALYAHVASKEQLLFDVVVIGTEVQRERMRDALLSSDPDPFAQIRALARAHVITQLDYPSLARVVNREIRALGNAHLADVRVVRRDIEGLVIDVIERGIRLGAFAADNPRLAALAIAAMGIRSAEWISREELPSDDEIANTFAEYAVRIVRADGADGVPR